MWLLSTGKRLFGPLGTMGNVRPCAKMMISKDDRASAPLMILVHAPRVALRQRALSRLEPPRLFSLSHPSLKKREELNFNPEVYFDDTPNPEHTNYKRVTSNDLEAFKRPPRRVKMLVRDYIEDSLYNPHYGYFSKRATIVTSPKHIDFASLRDSVDFQEEVARRYVSYGKDESGPGKQLWHTPTEIFKVPRFVPYVLRTSYPVFSHGTDRVLHDASRLNISSSTFLTKISSSTRLEPGTERLP